MGLMIKRLFGKVDVNVPDEIYNEFFDDGFFDVFDLEDKVMSLEEFYNEKFENNALKFSKFLKALFDAEILDESIVDYDDMESAEFNNNFLPTIYGFLKNDGDINVLENVISVHYIDYVEYRGYELESANIFFVIRKEDDDEFWDDLVKNYVREVLEEEGLIVNLIHQKEINISEIIDECADKDKISEYIKEDIENMDIDNLIDYAKKVGLYKQIKDADEMDEDDLRDEILYLTQKDHIMRYFNHIYDGSLYNFMSSFDMYDEDTLELIQDYGYGKNDGHNTGYTLAIMNEAIKRGLVDYDCLKNKIVEVIKTHPNINLSEYFYINEEDEFSFNGHQYILYSREI